MASATINVRLKISLSVEDNVVVINDISDDRNTQEYQELYRKILIRNITKNENWKSFMFIGSSTTTTLLNAQLEDGLVEFALIAEADDQSGTMYIDTLLNQENIKNTKAINDFIDGNIENENGYLSSNAFVLFGNFVNCCIQEKALEARKNIISRLKDPNNYIRIRNLYTTLIISNQKRDRENSTELDKSIRKDCKNCKNCHGNN